jgi:hypothetical protein
MRYQFLPELQKRRFAWKAAVSRMLTNRDPAPRKQSDTDSAMVDFRVAFDGRWQGKFDDLAEAIEWAQEVSSTGRQTVVIEHRRLSWRFCAAFPEEKAEQAREQWKRARDWRRLLGAFATGFNSG